MHPELSQAYNAVRDASYVLENSPEHNRDEALAHYNKLVQELPQIAARVNGTCGNTSTTDGPNATLH